MDRCAGLNCTASKPCAATSRARRRTSSKGQWKACSAAPGTDSGSRAWTSGPPQWITSSSQSATSLGAGAPKQCKAGLPGHCRFWPSSQRASPLSDSSTYLNGVPGTTSGRASEYHSSSAFWLCCVPPLASAGAWAVFQFPNAAESPQATTRHPWGCEPSLKRNQAPPEAVGTLASALSVGELLGGPRCCCVCACACAATAGAGAAAAGAEAGAGSASACKDPHVMESLVGSPLCEQGGGTTERFPWISSHREPPPLPPGGCTNSLNSTG
mmetsp:Transcript_175029/g.561280  ORF Transcript_175029/g.561280 Transcript_175029/m.561280 type:complete len:270 (+) Transcript_175029:1680-2489(+)